MLESFTLTLLLKMMGPLLLDSSFSLEGRTDQCPLQAVTAPKRGEKERGEATDS